MDTDIIESAFMAAMDAEYTSPIEWEDNTSRDGGVPVLCGEVVGNLVNLYTDEVEAGNMAFDSEEDLRAAALQEAFIRVFEVGYRVGLAQGEEGEAVEVTVQLTKEQVAGLVQRALGTA